MNHQLPQPTLQALEEADIFPPFNSAHEGYAILKEEIEELWQEIKRARNTRPENLTPQERTNIMREAHQVAAVALKFIRDIGQP